MLPENKKKVIALIFLSLFLLSIPVAVTIYSLDIPTSTRKLFFLILAVVASSILMTFIFLLVSLGRPKKQVLKAMEQQSTQQKTEYQIEEEQMLEKQLEQIKQSLERAKQKMNLHLKGHPLGLMSKQPEKADKNIASQSS